jgi:RNA polymerase sigma factor (TIGR02999 family)
MGDSSNNREEIDGLLEAIRDGDESAMDRLAPLVIGELRVLAHSRLRFERRDHTLNTNALVNEVYLRMLSKPQQDWKNRAYFFGVAARMMRNILVDYERERRALKRDHKLEVRGFELEGVAKTKERWLLDLDDALRGLEKVNESGAQIVDMHFFGGLTFEEIAEVLNTTRDAVRGRWRLAQAWLNREMKR